MNGQPAASRRPAFSILVLLFLFSGLGGLMYEVVWLRMLIRAFGVTVYAVTTVLAVFMGGLALGSFLAGKRTHRWKNLLKVYAGIEVLIGISALIATLLMQALPDILQALGPVLGTGSALRLPVQILIASVALLPTTTLMGATLPVLSGFAARTPATAGRRVGVLYAANTGGAVVGILLSGFLLLGLAGETGTSLVAVSCNVLVGVLAWLLARGRTDEAPPEPTHEAGTAAAAPILSWRALLWIYAWCGLAALAYQVVWSRLLIQLIGNSVYGFSCMLSIYLLGIAAGAAIMARYAEGLRHPVAALAGLLVATGILAVVSVVLLVLLGEQQNLPEYRYSRIWSARDFLDLPLYPLLIVFPVTLASGAIFPVVVRMHAGLTRRVSDSVGRLYGINTVGAIIGSLLTGFVLLPLLGSLSTLQILAFLSCVLGAWLLFKVSAATGLARFRVAALVSLLIFVGALSFSFRDPILSILMRRLPDDAEVLLHTEGRSGAVTVVDAGELLLYINGQHVSSKGNMSRLFFAYLPAALHPEPEAALAVGLGAGEAATGFWQLGLHTTVAELVPEVVRAYPLFHPKHTALLDDPRVDIVRNDGRNFLLQTRDRFDIIVVDGSPPIFASGTVNLYTREFVQLAHDRLTDSGLLAIWVPVPCFESDFWMIARNFTEVFPRVMAWTHDSGFGTLLVGTSSDQVLLNPAPRELAKRLQRYPATPRVKEALFDLLTTRRQLTDAQVRAYAQGFPAVTDDMPYTEFPMFRFLREEPFYRDSSYLDLAIEATTR
ncbi:MAG: fused MFS/spermidine synthase [Pseudomonadota bacterium]